MNSKQMMLELRRPSREFGLHKEWWRDVVCTFYAWLFARQWNIAVLLLHCERIRLS
jgi:hypothetical protein